MKKRATTRFDIFEHTKSGTLRQRGPTLGSLEDAMDVAEIRAKHPDVKKIEIRDADTSFWDTPVVIKTIGAPMSTNPPPRFAIEIDSERIERDINLSDELPHGARILQSPEWEKKAEAEMSRGRTYRRPARPIYLVIEWTGRRGEVGRLLDFVEDPRFPITRYAELYT